MMLRYEMLSWAGIMVPSKTPREIAAALHKAALIVLERPDVIKRYRDVGFTVMSARPEEMQAYVKAEIEKYATITFGVQADVRCRRASKITRVCALKGYSGTLSAGSIGGGP